MPSPKSDSPKEESSLVSKQVEGNVNTANGGPPPIGWNIKKSVDCTMPSYLTEVHLSHQQISKRFGDLLNLFEDYTQILRSEHERSSAPIQLKRVLSDVVINEGNKNVETFATSSATELSECILNPRNSQAATCEVSSQTYWSAVEQRQSDMKELEAQLAGAGGSASVECGAEKPSKTLQHTIHIEVESVTSATDMQRAPLRQRMWNVLTQTTDSVVACTYMIGENFTYALFIVLCLSCLYLLMGHYYSSLPTNVNDQMSLKKDLARPPPK